MQIRPIIYQGTVKNKLSRNLTSVELSVLNSVIIAAPYKLSPNTSFRMRPLVPHYNEILRRLDLDRTPLL